MKIMRNIIEIDEELCDGCGQCVPNCAEGALQIVDGKARLIAEKFCDGLGACLGECPTGALRIVEREAEDFDEEAVEAFLEQKKKEKEAARFAGCQSAKVCSFSTPPPSPCAAANVPRTHAEMRSALGHWPIKIYLVPPEAPFLKNADLLVVADCTAVSYPAFHQEFVEGKAVMMGCPKFDDAELYVNRFAEIFRKADIRSVTVVMMEVPCCSAMMNILKKAVELSDADVPLRRIVVGIKGDIKEDQDYL